MSIDTSHPGLTHCSPIVMQQSNIDPSQHQSRQSTVSWELPSNYPIQFWLIMPLLNQLSLLFWYIACSFMNSDTSQHCSTHALMISLGILKCVSWNTISVMLLPGSCSSICLPYTSRSCIICESYAAWCAHTTLTFLGNHCDATCTPTTWLFINLFDHLLI